MPDDWISAANAVQLVAVGSTEEEARRAICSRAYSRLLDVKAVRLVTPADVTDKVNVPFFLWWRGAGARFHENWKVGDFEATIRGRHRYRAFGVSFSRAGIEAMIGSDTTRTAPPVLPHHPGGRPTAAWWDDLWVEIARQLWVGDLKPTRQSDIEKAMMEWLSQQGHDPATSTIRTRARKLWLAICGEVEN